MAAHPLRKEPKWRFSQPPVRVRSSLVVIPQTKGSKSRAATVSGGSSCREGTIQSIRQSLLTKTAQSETTRKRSTWGGTYTERKYQRTHDVDLEDRRNKRAGRTTLSIQKRAIAGRAYQKFLHVADAIVGPIGVLINPDRPKGCCKASTGRNVGKTQLIWHGVDNTILYTPALVSMFAGLYRQCALLCNAGYADEILSVVDRSEIRRIIERVDEEAAREVIAEMKQWIEVPVPRYAHRNNMAFPPGYFSRLEQISRAVEKHGAHAVFSGEFLESWGFTGRTINGYYGAKRGLWSAWGGGKQGNTTYQKIAKLSRSRKKNRPALRD